MENTTSVKSITPIEPLYLSPVFKEYFEKIGSHGPLLETFGRAVDKLQLAGFVITYNIDIGKALD